MHARRYVAQLADEWVCWTVGRGPLIGKLLSRLLDGAEWMTGDSLLRVGSGMLHLSAAVWCWVGLLAAHIRLFRSLAACISLPPRPFGDLAEPGDVVALMIPALCSMRCLSHLPIASPRCIDGGHCRLRHGVKV